MDESQNIRVRDREDPHVRATADTALFYDLGRLVDDVHEADRARSDTARRVDHRTGRTQELVRHPGAAAGLVNDRDILRVLHDAFDRVGYVQHETSGELPLWLTCVHQARRVRNEFPCEHDRRHVVIESRLSLRIGFGP